MVLVAIFQLRREQELAMLRTDFVSSVSHQLRTPLAQIVDVRLRKGTAGTIQLLVKDEGEGIPEAERSEIFAPYSRLERDRESGVAGSGIGLAVVRELARRQGASVRVESSVSGGARFVVAFPRGVVTPAEG